MVTSPNGPKRPREEAMTEAGFLKGKRYQKENRLLPPKHSGKGFPSRAYGRGGFDLLPVRGDASVAWVTPMGGFGTKFSLFRQSDVRANAP